ncbi:MAG: class I SAM-dependent methyltransferase [Pirellula sp.]
MTGSNDHRDSPSSWQRPSWQLPKGVSRGTWDYVNDRDIASDYNRFNANHPLLDLDRSLIRQHLSDANLLQNGSERLAIDFGCGTGRNLIPLAEAGWNVIGFDLSQQMLIEFQNNSKAAKSTPFDKYTLSDISDIRDRCAQIHANMVEADCIVDQSADAVLCMYSSFGMIQGRENRRRFLAHAHRILKQYGLFFVHVHNRGSWLRDPGGIQRTVKDWFKARFDKTWEFGDRIYPYRGLPSMYLHIYSEKELISDLKSAQLKILKLYRLDRESKMVANLNWFAHLRAGGFLAVCTRS